MKGLEGDAEKSHRAKAVQQGSPSPFLSSVTKSSDNQTQSIPRAAK